ncbi:glycosyltransferase WbsX family protein [Gottfriedia acidiceleris]|uniref:glycosyltransferase WbsX family protein n=1 Tax=Gottfriedia acidiceleris TaxID=371036 RepID=UPI003D21D515
MKYISFYLPQFHEIPENNNWWGKGFTEWVNTKKAEPFFKNHKQPKTPLDENYYDLSEVETMEWQVELAKKYGIYGFCFYHYWFNGKRLLEKPIINFLENKQIDFPFCLSWANEPWTRSWDGKLNEVLMPQEYGNKQDWKQHFDCLFDYFIDDRYIRIDNKPVFVIYRPSGIEHCEEMLEYWNELALSKGFEGIYFVETLTSFDNKYVNGFNASIEFEPMYTLKHHMDVKTNVKRVYNKLGKNIFTKLGMGKKLFLDKVNYDDVWNAIINRPIIKRRENHFLGSFVNWDNTARKKDKGLVLTGFSTEKFRKFNHLQVERAKSIESEFIFINAWNEWAEGTYLEPDNENEYGYLEALNKVIDNN